MKPGGYLDLWIIVLLMLSVNQRAVLTQDQRSDSRLAKSNEYRIKRLLMRTSGYDPTTRPVKEDKTTIDTNVAISLYHILDTNEKEQTFTSQIAIRMRWKDEYLKWNPLDFDNVSEIHIPANEIWTPDLVISNFAGDKFNDYMITNAIVYADGGILWLYPALVKTYCTLNVKYFPFDTQKCQLIFISWTYSGYQLDIQYNTNFSNGIYYKPENQEWRVNGITVARHEVKYACCEAPYPDVTFTIHMTRGSLFYVVNLIIPCFLIFVISFLGFFLPVESGEKVNLEITILLALVVFLLMVGEMMPPTPDAIPILGMFFGCTMLMVSIALVMAVIVTNIYGKKDSYERCPRWMVRLATKFYPRYMKNFQPEREARKPYHKWRTHSGNGAMPGDITSLSGACEKESLTDVGCCPQWSDMPDDPQDHHPPRSHRERRNTLVAQMPSFDQDRNSAEWRMVAKFMDRILFWVYLVLSLATQVALFAQMIPATPRDIGENEYIDYSNHT